MHTPAEWSELWPEGTTSTGWSHSGIALLTDNRVAFAHPDGRWLMLFAENTGQVQRIDTGLTELHHIHRVTENGEDFLWIVDNGHKFLPATPEYTHHLVPGRVVKLRLDGSIAAELRQPETDAYASQFWNPTAFTIDDIAEGGSGAMWVADGYATNLLHQYDQHGNYVRSVDGSTSGIPFSVPHGLIIDRRSAEPRLVVADRSNERIVVMTLDGEFISVITDKLLTSPSGFTICGNTAFVTQLHGTIVAIDRNDNVRVAYPSPDGHDAPGWPNTRSADSQAMRPPVAPGVLNSPHGITMSRTGEIYVTEWLIGGRVSKISLAR